VAQGVVVDDGEHVGLARDWWEALKADGFAPGTDDRLRQQLPGLVGDLLVAAAAEPFDAAPGAAVGRALVASGLVDDGVPARSAQVLYRLAGYSPHTDAPARIAALLAALGQGHQAAVTTLRTPMAGQYDDRFRMVFDHVAAAVAIGDTEGRLLEANRGLADMIGVPVDALRGISVYDFAHPDDRDHIRNLLYDKLVPNRSGTVKLERRLVRADGSVGWMSFAITYVAGTSGNPDYLLAVGADVTDTHQQQEELHRQSRHDPLTGLPNRRLLLERIDELVATAGPDDRAGFFFIDIDYFKAINDRFGHRIGDQALAAIATRLRNSLHDPDCLIARIGGDEFGALIPPPADTARLTLIANRLLSALTEPITVSDRSLQISASIGAVITPIPGMNSESLLAAADTSLYYAKATNKGHWILQTLDAPA
jgi:diguanylate cyclase (GGDEF)-like protein/PAS domain S-box-containing protein